MVGDRALRGAGLAASCAGALACAFGLWAEATRSPARLAAAGEAALARGDVGTALAAARAEARMDPSSAPAQHRLAYASILAAGGPTREALAALAAAYEAAPFPPPEQMAWRVDLADAYWPTMPDPLAEAALSQVEALGGMGTRWPVRERWCRTARTDAVAAAACRTTPGIRQGVPKPKPAVGP